MILPKLQRRAVIREHVTGGDIVVTDEYSS
jgi:hypothetical protein